MAAKAAEVPWREPRHPSRPKDAAALLYDWQVGRLDDDRLFAAWAEALGGRFDGDEARRMSEAWLQGELEGVVDIARALSCRGVALGCLSNTCHHHWELLLAQPDRYPTMTLLTHRHASHLLGCMKPAPRIFEMYESAVGKTGADIVYFDDSVENVEAARLREWRAVRIGPDQPSATQVRAALDAWGLLPSA